MTGFLEHLSSYSIYLGSRSPRREKLLRQTGIPFTVWVKDETDEVFPDKLLPHEVAVYLARQKTEPYMPELLTDGILITADTTVILDGQVMGKPVNEQEAVDMVSALAGKSHEVVTGICIRSLQSIRTFASVTEVFFSRIDEEEVRFYVQHYQPFDKAGSYGIQEWIGLIGVQSISGSYFNVMGLPVQALYRELKLFTHYKNRS